MIRTMPTVVKLKAVDDHFLAKPGETVHCQLFLERTPNFDGAMDVELIAAESTSGFAADRVRIAAGATRAEIFVRVGDLTRCPSDLSLKFRAVGQLREDVTLISETSIPVRNAP